MNDNRNIQLILFVSSILSLAISVYQIWQSPSLLLVLTIGIFLVTLFFGAKFELQRRKLGFEYLRHKITIEILDKKGEAAKYRLQARMKCLKSDAEFIDYEIHTSGRIENLKENNLKIKHSQHKSGITSVKISLMKVMKRGELFDIDTSCELLDTFISEDEYWDSNRWYPGKDFTITIIFPKDRPCSEYWGYEKDGRQLTRTKIQPQLKFNDGHAHLTWSITRPRFRRSYRVKWNW